MHISSTACLPVGAVSSPDYPTGMAQLLLSVLTPLSPHPRETLLVYPTTPSDHQWCSVGLQKVISIRPSLVFWVRFQRDHREHTPQAD